MQRARGERCDESRGICRCEGWNGSWLEPGEKGIAPVGCTAHWAIGGGKKNCKCVSEMSMEECDCDEECEAAYGLGC